jgi:hypothetical protein
MKRHDIRTCQSAAVLSLMSLVGIVYYTIVSKDDMASKLADAAGEYLEERARRGSREKFLAVLAKVPAVPPEAEDEL